MGAGAAAPLARRGAARLLPPPRVLAGRWTRCATATSSSSCGVRPRSLAGVVMSADASRRLACVSVAGDAARASARAGDGTRHDAEAALRPVPLLRRPAERRLRGPRHARRWPTPTSRPSVLSAMEPFYPLRALVCGRCFLVQLRGVRDARADLLRVRLLLLLLDQLAGALPRATSRRWSQRLGLGRATARVVEIASNDGYLLQYFRERQHPRARASSPRPTSRRWRSQKGIPTLVEFFGRATARSLAAQARADLLVGNNVLAHVPDINDFVGGMKILLAPGGVAHDGVPAPAAAHRRAPVGHDLPRALLLLLVPHRQRACSRPTACACSTSRSCPRTAARCASTAATRTTPASPTRERAHRLRERERRRATAARDLHRLRRAASRPTSARSSISSSTSRTRAGGWSATARRPRATRCSTTAACAPTSSTTR